MKTFLSVVLFIFGALMFLFCFELFASEPSLAEVLEWKYGLVAGTKQADPSDMSANPKMVIKYWKHPSIPQPDEAQIDLDREEYKTFLTQKEQETKDKKEAALLKLKVSESELKDALRGVGVNV